MRLLERVLLVEPDLEQGLQLQRYFRRDWRLTPLCVRSGAEVPSVLRGWQPDLLLLRISGGELFDAVRAGQQLRPAPLVIVIGDGVRAAEAFALGAAGVHAFVATPFDGSGLSLAVRRALETPPELAPLLRAAVSHRGLPSVLRQARRLMVEEALALAGGNRSEAARLLQVSRQAVQQAIRSADESTERIEERNRTLSKPLAWSHAS